MNKHNITTTTQTIVSADSNGLQLQTIPTRVHGFMIDKMKAAVAELNKGKKEGERELTVADFLRIAAAEKVANVLHEDVSELPPVIRGRGGSMVAQAAKKLGLSQDEFVKRAGELVAAQAFGYKGPGNELMEQILNGQVPVVGGGGNSTSGQAKSSQSGQHRITTHRAGPNSTQARRAG